jgi:uncharacterized protein YcfJ
MKKSSLPAAIIAVFLVESILIAESFSTTEYVRVSQSIPSYRTVNEQVPSEQCQDVREAIQDEATNGDVIGAIAGGALGGVLGHQVGGGKGKTAATVAGAILGTLAGQNAGSKYNTPQNGTYQVVRKCETVYSTKTRRIIGGYTNIATFKGKEVHVESDRQIDQIPITITYSY